MEVTPNNWDSVRKFVVEQTEAGKGTETKIKLIKKNNGDAMFPYFLNYNRASTIYTIYSYYQKNL